MKRQRSEVVASSTITHHATLTKKAKHSKQSQLPAVEVVTCAASFPISQNKRTKHSTNNSTYDDDAATRDFSANKSYSSSDRKKKSFNKLLDWNETAREVRTFGAQGWGATTVGSKNKHDDNMTPPPNIKTNSILDRKNYRAHQNEQYEQLTGRTKKQHAVPLPIVRGIKKKAIAREQRIIQEARDSGIVLPTNNSFVTSKSKDQREKNKKRQNYKTNEHYGPAPSIGFMKQGVFRVRGDGSDKKRQK